MDSYFLITKTLWTAILHGTWSQIFEVTLLSLALMFVGTLLSGLRYAIYLSIAINITIFIVYRCLFKSKRLSTTIYILLFILIIYKQSHNKHE